MIGPYLGSRRSSMRWQKLTRFLDDVEVEIDTNLVENRVRPIVIDCRPICLLAPMKRLKVRQ